MNYLFKIVYLVMILLFSSCNFFAPGTYVHAEYYTLEVTIEELIEEIKNFKELHPEYRFLRIQSDGSLKEVKDQYVNNTYTIFFYLPDRELLLHCVIKRNNQNLARLGFYSVSNTNFAGYGNINTSELTKEQNAEFKRIFEQEVLTPLKEFISTRD